MDRTEGTANAKEVGQKKVCMYCKEMPGHDILFMCETIIEKKHGVDICVECYGIFVQRMCPQHRTLFSGPDKEGFSLKTSKNLSLTCLGCKETASAFKNTSVADHSTMLACRRCYQDANTRSIILCIDCGMKVPIENRRRNRKRKTIYNA